MTWRSELSAAYGALHRLGGRLPEMPTSRAALAVPSGTITSTNLTES